MDIKEKVKRIGELLESQESLRAELDKCNVHIRDIDIKLDEIEAELITLTGIEQRPPDEPPIGRIRTCKLCNQKGHITAQAKTADGKPTSKTYPKGKPKEE